MPTQRSALRTVRALAVAGVCAWLSTGCLARQLAADGKGFRQALLDMYTDQVMDNLVRASEGLPFVQLSYRNLVVTEIQTVKANVGDESDPSTSRTVAQRTAALITSMRNYTNKLFFGGSLERDRQMQFQADPVTGKADVYDYYLAFARDPLLFCVGDVEPPCPVHIKRRCHGKWYWVPADAGPVFLQLALKTTFMRGPEPPPTVYWPTTIVAIKQAYRKTGEPDVGNHVITFASKVPNDDGYASLTLTDGRKLRLKLAPRLIEPYEPGKKKQDQVPGPKRNTMVTTLYAEDDPGIAIVYTAEPATPKQAPSELLINRPVNVFAENNPNLGPPPRSLEEQRLEDALTNYRRMKAENP
jgi:hypothetical protein